MFDELLHKKKPQILSSRTNGNDKQLDLGSEWKQCIVYRIFERSWYPTPAQLIRHMVRLKRLAIAAVTASHRTPPNRYANAIDTLQKRLIYDSYVEGLKFV